MPAHVRGRIRKGAISPMTDKEPRFEGNFFHHPCSVGHCPRHGCIGEGVNLLKGRLGKWYCAEHYKELEHKRKTEKAEFKPIQERQGRLF